MLEMTYPDHKLNLVHAFSIGAIALWPFILVWVCLQGEGDICVCVCVCKGKCACVCKRDVLQNMGEVSEYVGLLCRLLTNCFYLNANVILLRLALNEECVCVCV